MNETKTVSKDVASGDCDAMERLYSETNRMAYYTALSILKNDADAQDAVQSSYVDAYTKMSQLKDTSAFAPWLKKIVVNNCINMLKKKTPALFRSDEEERLTLDGIPEQSEEFLPEDYILQETKRKQIMDIINALPEQQRMTILMFYYDELSVKEIAAVMGCSESTVTSRISYAKKYIKKEVERLEKKGDKLYGAMPLPFLAKLFAEDAKSQVFSPDTLEKVWRQVVSSLPGIQGVASKAGTASAAAKAKPLSKAAAKIAGMTVRTKAIIAGIAAVLLVAGAVIPAVTGNKANEQTQAVATTEQITSSMSADTASVTSASPSDEVGQDALSADYFIPDLSKTYFITYKPGGSELSVYWSDDVDTSESYAGKVYCGQSIYSLDDTSGYDTMNVSDGYVYWQMTSSGSGAWYLTSGSRILMAPVKQGESWENNWTADHNDGGTKTGYDKYTFIGLQEVAVAGQTMMAAILHHVCEITYPDSNMSTVNVERDELYVKDIGYIGTSDWIMVTSIK